MKDHNFHPVTEATLLILYQAKDQLFRSPCAKQEWGERLEKLIEDLERELPDGDPR